MNSSIKDRSSKTSSSRHDSHSHRHSSSHHSSRHRSYSRGRTDKYHRSSRSDHDKHRHNHKRRRHEDRTKEETSKKNRHNDIQQEQSEEDEEYQRNVERELELLENKANLNDSDEKNDRKRRWQMMLKEQSDKTNNIIKSDEESNDIDTTSQDNEYEEKWKKLQEKSECIENINTEKIKKSELKPDEQNNNTNNNIQHVQSRKVAFSFDIFGDKSDQQEEPITHSESRAGSVAADTENLTLIDNWDNSEGYYCCRPNDLLNNRFLVYADQGHGVFSTVLRVRDQGFEDRELVIKVIRNNQIMYRAGLIELECLKTLAQHDPNNRSHCIRLITHFEQRNHLCLVFEPMKFNLREVLKKFGGIGIHLDAVRTYARQMFIALRHLKKCTLIHADIKPDNILVSADMRSAKLCDFGSAFFASKWDPQQCTPYLCSRFYRSCEIILGHEVTYAADIWALGTVFYELYTGKILFQGDDNNEMLRLIMEARGQFPKKMLKKSLFVSQYFDSSLSFLQRRKDPVSGEIHLRPLQIIPHRDLKSELESIGRRSRDDITQVSSLVDLIEQCLIVDPSKRITPDVALHHPFFHPNQKHTQSSIKN